jgi:glycosyltransferase involved in cell wall biosynthesis
MASPALPRLLYVGDVQVESTYQSSLQLFRLLERYPTERLLIVETRERPSRAECRLPGVTYRWMPLSRKQWIDSGRSAYWGWQLWSASARAARLRRLLAEFAPEAVVTIATGAGWLVAAELARRLDVPIHVVAHDDWPKQPHDEGFTRAWLRRRARDIYRQARSRLCISPFMVEELAARYDVEGTLVYPTRPDDGPLFEPKWDRAPADGGPLVVGYCGGSGPHVMSGLATLAEALTEGHARLVIYGAFDADKRRRLGAISPNVECRGFATYDEMMAGLRAADVLFVPMSFASEARDNMRVSFPSKLVDYTALGLPILVHAPPDSSAVQWSKRHGDVAEIVESPARWDVVAALRRLSADPDRRRHFAQKAREVGDRCFAAGSGRVLFQAALTAPPRR